MSWLNVELTRRRRDIAAMHTGDCDPGLSPAFCAIAEATDVMWSHTAHRREHCAMFHAHRRAKSLPR